VFVKHVFDPAESPEVFFVYGLIILRKNKHRINIEAGALRLYGQRIIGGQPAPVIMME
jgi:hypothetical protein